MSEKKDFQRWINEVMPKIIKSLGPHIDKVQYEVHDLLGISIMSKMYRVHLHFENKISRQSEELSIILKRPMLGMDEVANVNFQFHNEILFYKKYVREDQTYAKCFYVEKRPPVDSVITLEDLNKREYYSSKYVYDAPEEYIFAAMREMGRFHGKGYVTKELQREKFFDIVAQIKEVRYIKKKENIYKNYFNIHPMRAIEYLRNQNYDAVFCDKMEAYFSNLFDTFMLKIIEPIEPLATLSHGDFTLCNILFKTKDDGQLYLKLIDFGLIRYSNPVIDLSTLLWVCCSNEMRKDKFYAFMQAYHDALKEYLLDAGIRDVEKYSYDALLDDFRRGGLFGYVMSCPFIPVLLGYLPANRVVQEIIELGILESVKRQASAGGDEVSKIFAESLLHLKDLGCLEHIL